MKERRKKLATIFGDMIKLIFASIVLGHFIYPEKIGLEGAIIGFVIVVLVITLTWFTVPSEEENNNGSSNNG